MSYIYRTLGLLLIMIMVGGVLAACGDQGPSIVGTEEATGAVGGKRGTPTADTATPEGTPKGTPEASPERGLTVADILADPEQYVNKRVSVDGEVASVITNLAFTITAEGDTNGEELLVINAAQDAQATIEQGTAVTVRGEVHRFDLQELERSLGVDLPDEQLAQFDGEPVILAQRVTTGR